MAAVGEAAPVVGVSAACSALGLARPTFYRRRTPRVRPAPKQRPGPSRALSRDEREQVLAELHSDRFVDKAPAEVYAALLDESKYYCSIRTMYRLLAAHGEVRERRDQLRHPVYKKPELLATAPNQVWSWDITKLLGPVKWSYYYLYVILDIYSRYAVGWMLARREAACLAKRLIRETCDKEGIQPSQLTIHSDRGSPMTAITMAQLLATLGVTKSFSRPKVSNDNPFSESQFKTMKYRPDFPDRFATFDEALAYCRDFFPWYNCEHRHQALGLLTPQQVHVGLAPTIITARANVLQTAYDLHPERFVRRPPSPAPLPQAVWINPPGSSKTDLGLQ